MRKNKLKNFVIVSIVVIAVVAFIVYLLSLGPFMNARDPYFYEVPREEWSTSLTEEEHYQNIVERTEQILKREEGTHQPPLELLSYEVYLVYSFDDNPEFFLVEFIYAPSDAWEEKKHIMGRIFNDEYYEILCMCYEHEESIYTKAGVLDKKLYFHYDPWGKKETIFAYEHNGNIFRITDIYKRNYDPSEIKNIPVGWTKIIYG